MNHFNFNSKEEKELNSSRKSHGLKDNVRPKMNSNKIENRVYEFKIE